MSIPITEVISGVCRIYGLSVDILKETDNRSCEVYECRWAISWILLNIYGMTLKSVSNRLRIKSIAVPRHGNIEFEKILNNHLGIDCESSRCTYLFKEDFDRLVEFINEVRCQREQKI